MTRRIEDVFTIERAVAAFAPEKRRVPVRRKWLQEPERDGDGASKSVCMCLVTAILLDEAGSSARAPTLPDVLTPETMAPLLNVPVQTLRGLLAGWDDRPLANGGKASDLGAACWEAVQKASRQGPPAG